MKSFRKLSEENLVPTGIGEKIAKILIVEDESLVGWSLAEALERIGFETKIVESGEEAIENFTASRFDLVLTDLKLPHIDGFQVASIVKSASPSTPVFLMSASESQFSRDSIIGGKIDCFIAKPFNLKEVTSLVSKYITKKDRSC